MGKLNISASDFKKKMKAKLFISTTGEPCITVNDKDKVKSFFLNDNQWKEFLIRYFSQHSPRVTEYQRDDFNSELIALASESDQKKDVFVRVARLEDSVIIDLNNAEYEYVHIDKTGFSVKTDSPVPFVRPMKQSPLPRPTRMDREEFVAYVKDLFRKEDKKWLLILAFLLKCLHRDNGAYVFLVLGGPQGSGKTTLSNRIKSLIDPSNPSSYSPPNNTDDIIVASMHSYLLMFDNMSSIEHRMADTFCRLSTGGGLSKRKHYENHGEAFYVLHRPCIINGIDEPSNRPDFLDRCINVELQPLLDANRVSETHLNQKFESKLPSLLGGLYTLLSDCLKVLPKVQTNGLPRMTDYARMGIALEKTLKLNEGTFLGVYNKCRTEQLDNTFWTDDLCSAIYKKLHGDSLTSNNGDLCGTASELSRSILRGSHGKQSVSARGFSGWLKRVEPVLKERGILVERLPRTHSERKIRIYLSERPLKKKFKKLKANL